MINKPLDICHEEDCNKCNLAEVINCHFTIKELVRFYIISLPSFILGGLGIYYFDRIVLLFWILYTAVFFLVIETRVLCPHCPHYAQPTNTLRCWANFGFPKSWKYKPTPLNRIEKIILLAGFILIWGSPAVAISLNTLWILLGIYLISVLLFFYFLGYWQCSRCVNITCPLNRVNNNVKQQFSDKIKN